jgi:hypothetical protein
VLEVKGHIPHFQKREKRGCRTMILLLPLFWKTLRKSWMFSMEGKNHHYSKIKNGMFEAKWHFFLYFLSLLKDWPPLSVFSQGLSFTFRPLFGPTPHHFPVHLQWFATPQLSTYWGCTPPALSGPLRKIVLHFTTHSYASALIRLWGETFISASFPTHSVTEK